MIWPPYGTPLVTVLFQIPERSLSDDLLIKDGCIAEIAPGISCETDLCIDCIEFIVMPGCIDIHRHSDLVAFTTEFGVPEIA